MNSTQTKLNHYFDGISQRDAWVYTNVISNVKTIATQSVASKNGESEASSLMGRAICAIHVAATPLKALAGIGLLATRVMVVALAAFSILTLNRNPKDVKVIVHMIIDVVAGTVLLPIALLANIIRGTAGAIFHPGALIRDVRGMDYNDFAATHNILQGTLVHYPL